MLKKLSETIKKIEGKESEKFIYQFCKTKQNGSETFASFRFEVKKIRSENGTLFRKAWETGCEDAKRKKTQA